MPWDALISREHAEVQLVSGQLRVRRLDTARNPIYYLEADNTDFLVSQGVKMIVVACNTSTAVSACPSRRSRAGT